MTKTWVVELVTDEIRCNRVEIDANHIEKISYSEIHVDGTPWVLPPLPGLSFAAVEIEDDD